MLHLIYKLTSILTGTNILCILFICLCVILSWKFLRTLYYLGKISGPKGWPIIGNILIVKNISKADVYFKIFEENGNFFKLWFGPLPVVLVSDPNILQEIFKSPNTLNRGWMAEIFIRPMFRDSIAIARVEKWKHTRKMCNYGFSQLILNSFLPIFNDVNVRLIEQLKNEIDKTQPFNVHTYFRRVALDSICAAAMGVNINTLQTAKNCSYSHALETTIETIMERLGCFWMYPDFIFNLTALGKKQKKSLNILWDMTNKVFDTKLESMKKNCQTVEEQYKNIDQPIERNPLKKPFLDFLLDMVQVYPEFTIEQLKEEINILNMAAYETTPIGLSYAILVLGVRKDIQQKAYNEVFNIFGNSERPIELGDLSKLKYVEMVIKETLRLYPPVAHTIRATTDDMNLGNYFIPAGTTILPSILIAHRNPEYWQNPTEFDPDRFLTSQHPHAYMPFGNGPRNCIGAKYAMMFMKVSIANILRKYEIHTPLKLEKLNYRISVALELEEYLITITERKKPILADPNHNKNEIDTNENRTI